MKFRNWNETVYIIIGHYFTEFMDFQENITYFRYYIPFARMKWLFDETLVNSV